VERNPVEPFSADHIKRCSPTPAARTANSPRVEPLDNSSRLRTPPPIQWPMDRRFGIAKLGLPLRRRTGLRLMITSSRNRVLLTGCCALAEYFLNGRPSVDLKCDPLTPSSHNGFDFANDVLSRCWNSDRNWDATALRDRRSRDRTNAAYCSIAMPKSPPRLRERWSKNQHEFFAETHREPVSSRSRQDPPNHSLKYQRT